MKYIEVIIEVIQIYNRSNKILNNQIRKISERFKVEASINNNRIRL